MDSNSFDEQVVARLPLPLAQALRRAQNGNNALERHLAAYYTWESTLKLLGSVAVIEYAEAGLQDPGLAERLQNLVRPSLGHWWEFVRLLVPALADANVAGFSELRDLLLGRARDDMPRLAGLDAALLESLEGRTGSRTTVRLTELFDRMVRYRNRELGHGAGGQHSKEHHTRMGSVMLSGVAQLLTRIDVLAGRRLTYVADVHRQSSGDWHVQRYHLCGETPRQMEGLLWPEAAIYSLPRPQQIYLEQPAALPEGLPTLHALEPLAHFAPDTTRFFFLNARRGKRRSEFLCYVTGEIIQRDVPAADRRELLARVLGSPVADPDLDAWVAKNLAEEVPTEETSSEEAHPLAIRTIGEFELLSRLGSGGMGVVYRAWQPSLGRQVAVKCMLKSGDARAESRFAREIRALGRVEHPHLVKVFTSGVDGEQWFYAMELLEGAELSRVSELLASSATTAIDAASWKQAVSTACSQVKAQETSMSDSLPSLGIHPLSSADVHHPVEALEFPRRARVGSGYIDKVVEIVHGVADAAHTLHEAGVVHRDIKPGNIMLTADASQAVLMDLGLAQLADEVDSKVTRTRQFVGTLRYASPEQILAAGRVDRRTDVYSLGATLWELLTLRPIFNATDDTPTPELMLRIQTTDPDSVRKFNPQVPRDLEAVCLKCLEKEPDRRYQTARELSDDLARWKAGEPVIAQPPSLRYLASKFVRRYRWSMAASAAVLLLLIAGIVAGFLQTDKKRRDAQEANLRLIAEERKTQQALTQAQDNLRIADERLMALDGVMKVFSSAELRSVQGGQEIRERVLRETIQTLERSLGEQKNSPQIQESLVLNLIELADLRKELGRYQDALSVYERAIQQQRDLLSADPENPQRAAVLGDSLFRLAQCLFEVPNASKFPQVKAPCEESQAIFSKLASRFPDEPAYKAGLGKAMVRGTSVDNLPDAEICRRGIALSEEAVRSEPENSEWLKDLGNAWLILGYTLSKQNQSQESTVDFEKSREYARQALQKNPALTLAYRTFAVTSRNMSLDLRDQGKRDEAVTLLANSLTDVQPFAARNLAAIKAQEAVLDLQRELARMCRWQPNGNEKSLGIWSEIAESCRAHHLRDPSLEIFVVRRLEALHESTQIESIRDRKVTILDRALQETQDLAPKYSESVEIAVLLLQFAKSRAEIESTADRHQPALDVLRPAITRFMEVVPVDSPALGDSISVVLDVAEQAVKAANKVDDHKTAIAIGERAIQWGTRVVELMARESRTRLIGYLADAFAAEGDLSSAIRTYSQQCEESERALKAADWDYWLHSSYTNGLLNLVKLYRQSNDAEREFHALRKYLEDSSYYHAKNDKDMLAETKQFTPENLDRLRSQFESRVNQNMKRFTIPVDFNGTKYPFEVYITNAIQPFDDQCRWLKDVRGGIVPPEVVDSFHKLYKIATDNNVSYVDLCVYALSKDNKDVPASMLSSEEQEIVVLKKELEDEQDPQVQLGIRRRVAELNLRVAKQMYEQNSHAKALGILDETFTQLERDDEGRLRDPGARPILAEAIVLEGLATARNGNAKLGYEKLVTNLDILQPKPDGSDDWYGIYLLALGETARLMERPFEAATWCWQSADWGTPRAFVELIKIHAKDPACALLLPHKFGDLLNLAAILPAADPDRPQDDLATRLSTTWMEHRLATAERLHNTVLAWQKEEGEDAPRQADLETQVALLVGCRRFDPDSKRALAVWGQAVLDLAELNVDSGRSELAFQLVDRAVDDGILEGLERKARWYEEGLTVDMDLVRARALRIEYHTKLAARYVSDEDLARAESEFAALVELDPQNLKFYGYLAESQWQQNHWSQAADTYQRAFRLTSTEKAPREIVLSLLESLTIAGRAAEACRWSELLMASHWKPEGTAEEGLGTAATYFALQAIAGLAAGKDPTSAEARLKKILAMPGYSESNWDWSSLQDWLKSAELSDDARARIASILTRISESGGETAKE